MVITAWSEPNSSAGNSNLDRLRSVPYAACAAIMPRNLGRISQFLANSDRGQSTKIFLFSERWEPPVAALEPVSSSDTNASYSFSIDLIFTLMLFIKYRALNVSCSIFRALVNSLLVHYSHFIIPSFRSAWFILVSHVCYRWTSNNSDHARFVKQDFV